VPTPRRSTRSTAGVPAVRFDSLALVKQKKHITAHAGLRDVPDKARPAIVKELLSLLSKGVAHGVHRKDLSPEAVRKIIPSGFNLTQKFTLDSVGQGRVEDVFKGRLIGGGHRQDKSLYINPEISSPTVSVSSVFITVQIAAAENNEVRTLDIGSA
jgi:hypothetical protein